MSDNGVLDTTETQNILITGGGGQLAAACATQWSHATVLGRTQLDVRDQAQVRRCVQEHKPDLIINAAAYTNVEQAEGDPEAAYEVNALGPLYLAQAAAEAGAVLVHVSTDYVFDGTSPSYVEDDKIAPINIYGLSKAAGEMAVAVYCEQHYILRTSALYGPRADDKGDNFVTKRLVQIRSGAPIHMVNDQVTIPTYTVDVAESLRQLLALRAPFGVYHTVNSGEPVTWYEFSKAIAATAGLEIDITPINSRDSTSVVPRPTRTVLANSKLAALGIILPTWQNALDRYIAQIN